MSLQSSQVADFTLGTASAMLEDPKTGYAGSCEHMVMTAD